ncbi:complement decay-accelerating factor-like isoform X2 [Oenanthe melanoleuca]|uniref:complement decay-accelerating factor-like isoform X2 n=1 Tax=Oenanthe melanoleuca TaxID=2939378 RepID=UPI0024C183E7|nr:complement decay-accelerating factor-like isoform X2 [Oenanthe melanoleuca]
MLLFAWLTLLTADPWCITCQQITEEVFPPWSRLGLERDFSALGKELWKICVGFHSSGGLVEPAAPPLPSHPCSALHRLHTAMKAAAPAWGAHPEPPSLGVLSGLPVLLPALLGLLSIPAARGDCGPPPAMSHSRPSSSSSSFPVGSRVTFICSGGARRIPGLPDTTECLPGGFWSRLPEPCGRSCAAPARLRFAALSEEDKRRNFFPVGTNVSYVCRPGYENTSESSPSSTCLQNLTWSQPAELCRRRSCSAPGALPGGRMGPLTELQLGARVAVSCEDGYKLVGNDFIRCQLKGNDVVWSELPTCELITCSAPPPISHGTHDGQGQEIFALNSTVSYSCEPDFQLRGARSIRCTSGAGSAGVWSGAAPECKGRLCTARRSWARWKFWSSKFPTRCKGEFYP